jgi:riboflavin transporter FmnP
MSFVFDSIWAGFWFGIGLGIAIELVRTVVVLLINGGKK